MQAAHLRRCEWSRRPITALRLDAVVEVGGRRQLWVLQLQRELAQHAGHADIRRDQILDCALRSEPDEALT